MYRIHDPHLAIQLEFDLYFKSERLMQEVTNYFKLRDLLRSDSLENETVLQTIYLIVLFIKRSYRILNMLKIRQVFAKAVIAM